MTRVRIRAKQEHRETPEGFKLTVMPSHQELEVLVLDEHGAETRLTCVKRLELVSSDDAKGPITVRLDLYPEIVEIDAELAPQLSVVSEGG